MKIATVLSVSALLAMFSVVACTSPTPAASSDKSDSADSKGDEKDAKDAKDTKASTDAKASTDSKTATDPKTTGGVDEAACDACLATDPKEKAALECAAKCADEDDACHTKCYEDQGCKEGDANSPCAKIWDKCADKCEIPDGGDEGGPTPEELKACATCYAGNAQVVAIEKCYDDAFDKGGKDADYAKCEAMKCDASCESTYKTCAPKCGGTNGQDGADGNVQQ